MLKFLSKIKLLFLILVTGILVLVSHNVDKRLQLDDRAVLSLYLNEQLVEEDKMADQISFEEQVNLIFGIQKNMLSLAPFKAGIPKGQERGLGELIDAGKGLCYDKSYVLESIFEELGFRTRHVSLYDDRTGTGFFKDLSNPGTKSHACTEVLTQKGWLVVEPNFAWIAINKHGEPVSLEDEEEWKDASNFEKEPPYPIYTEDHHFIYGLYSRHGKFFKPYNFIPDYNLRGLLYNF